jgi:hypothetical protein
MIVDDDGRHLGGGEIGIVQTADELQVVFGGERFSEQSLPGSGGQENDRIAQIEDHYFPAMIEAPPTPHRGWNRHLAARRNQELSWHGHLHLTW